MEQCRQEARKTTELLSKEVSETGEVLWKRVLEVTDCFETSFCKSLNYTAVVDAVTLLNRYNSLALALAFLHVGVAYSSSSILYTVSKASCIFTQSIILFRELSNNRTVSMSVLCIFFLLICLHHIGRDSFMFVYLSIFLAIYSITNMPVFLP